jgi:hypothetical protein
MIMIMAPNERLSGGVVLAVLIIGALVANNYKQSQNNLLVRDRGGDGISTGGRH